MHIETSSLWAEFVNKNSVRLVSEEVKSITFLPEYFIDFFMLKMVQMSGFDIRLVFTLPPTDQGYDVPETVHCRTKDAYTSEITFLAL